MNPQEHVPLSEHTTFKIGGRARYFFRAKSVEDLKHALAFAKKENLPFFVLGGGSNLLVSDAGFSGVIIKNEILGLVFEDGSDEVTVKAGAGENWDKFVEACVERGLYGLENLSGIPGTVGAAPVQNIGAYGAEVKDTIVSVEALDSTTGELKTFSHADCLFSYRDSFFKTSVGKKFIITHVTFHLKKNGKLNLEYKDLKSHFGILPLEKGALRRDVGGGISKSLPLADSGTPFRKGRMGEPTPTSVRAAVLKIRSKKFPDLRTAGTAGSFFKNPIISCEQYEELKKRYPDLPSFSVPASQCSMLHVPCSMIKVPLAWILDNILHYKGFALGDIALHEAQPLVIINSGGGSAEDVRRLAADVALAVKSATGITVEWEVEFLG